MNIFVTDLDPCLSAQNLCDKHISKMLLESNQLLCSAFPINVAPYKRTHYNHPCTIWTRESKQNYEWLITHAYYISEEYKLRYKKEHKCLGVLAWVMRNYENLNLKDLGLTNFAQAMPEQYKVINDPVAAYRNYYKAEKVRFAKWVHGRNPPDWWI